MEKQTGIVLKTHFPKNRKITMLDHEGNKVHYVPSSQDLCVGTMLHYYVPSLQHTQFIHGVEKIGLPLLLARNDLLFFHHILELCYYFVPMGCGMPEVFSLVTQLYRADISGFTPLFKKIFLVKLFTIFGIVPDESRFNTVSWHRIMIESVDTLASQIIDLDMEHDLDEWIRCCIAMHPNHAYFKTVQFSDQ
jgi:hypothetical protein